MLLPRGMLCIMPSDLPFHLELERHSFQRDISHSSPLHSFSAEIMALSMKSDAQESAMKAGTKKA